MIQNKIIKIAQLQNKTHTHTENKYKKKQKKTCKKKNITSLWILQKKGQKIEFTQEN